MLQLVLHCCARLLFTQCCICTISRQRHLLLHPLTFLLLPALLPCIIYVLTSLSHPQCIIYVCAGGQQTRVLYIFLHLLLTLQITLSGVVVLFAVTAVPLRCGWIHWISNIIFQCTLAAFIHYLFAAVLCSLFIRARSAPRVLAKRWYLRFCWQLFSHALLISTPHYLHFACFVSRVLEPFSRVYRHGRGIRARCITVTFIRRCGIKTSFCDKYFVQSDLWVTNCLRFLIFLFLF